MLPMGLSDENLKRGQRAARLRPKLVHANKYLRLVRLEAIPILQIRGAGIIRKACQIAVDHGAIAHLKAHEFEIQRIQALGNLRQGKAMLFNMKEKIPAFLKGEKIVQRQNPLQWRIVR